jgi:hypothetical protein
MRAYHDIYVTLPFDTYGKQSNGYSRTTGPHRARN